MAIIIAIVIVVIYLASPLVGKAVLLLINTVIHDPIPFIDEIIMWIGLLHHLDQALCVADYIRDHKKTIIKIAIFVGIAIILMVLLLIAS